MGPARRRVCGSMVACPRFEDPLQNDLRCLARYRRINPETGRAGVATICVTGIWHQGAVLSACLADLGHEVRGVCDGSTLAGLNRGMPPVHEPLLPEIIT